MKTLPVLLLLFLLVSCSPAVTATPAPTETPVSTATVIPSPPTSTATEIPSIPNPIDPESMDLLTRAGYLWDEQTGSLNSKDGNTVLSFEDGKWVDRRGVESSLESLKINPTNGVDYDGDPVVAMLTRTIENEEGIEELQTFGPLSKEWFVPADVLASQELMDREMLSKEISVHDIGKFSYITLEEIPEVTAEFANSDKLLESVWLHLRPWPKNVREPELQCVKEDVIGNVWQLTQYPMETTLGHYTGNIYREREPGERPIVRENNGVNQHLAVFKFADPETGDWVVEQKIQYWQDGGLSTVLTARYTGEYTVPGTGYFKMLQQVIRNPAFHLVEPRCSPPEVRKLLPLDLRMKMAELDSDPNSVASRELPYYEIDDMTMAKLQEIKFYDFRNEPNQAHFYLRLESDPIFDAEFPDRLKD